MMNNQQNEKTQNTVCHADGIAKCLATEGASLRARCDERNVFTTAAAADLRCVYVFVSVFVNVLLRTSKRFQGERVVLFCATPDKTSCHYDGDDDAITR